MHRKFVLAGLAAVGHQMAAEADSPQASIYTPLSGPQCKVVARQAETGATVSKCPGVGGFVLRVLVDDSRASITLVGPDKKEHPLDLWNVVTRSFSSLGPRAEWRVIHKGGKPDPIALIARVEYSDQSDPAKPAKKSALAVAKVSAEQVCVTAKIPASPNANEQAREAAGKARSQPCLMPLD